jgi:two-component system cell cycle response regulator DivK
MGKKKKILVVDDTEFNRDLVVQLLEDEFELIIAQDGAEGLKQTQDQRPDLILMDLGMPVMDGWEATRRLKADDKLNIFR